MGMDWITMKGMRGSRTLTMNARLRSQLSRDSATRTRELWSPCAIIQTCGSNTLSTSRPRSRMSSISAVSSIDTWSSSSISSECLSTWSLLASSKICSVEIGFYIADHEEARGELETVRKIYELLEERKSEYIFSFLSSSRKQPICERLYPLIYENHGKNSKIAKVIARRSTSAVYSSRAEQKILKMLVPCTRRR